MLINWAESAEKDLSEIYAWSIGRGEETTGKRVVGLLIRSTGRLSDFPLSGKPGRIPGTRELVPPRLPYMLIYEIAVNKKQVEILHVIHTSRLWPENMLDE